MSTKMSTDMNITRPTSRVIRPPGGSSSNIFGSEPEPPKPAPVAKAPASPVKGAAPAPVAEVHPPAPPAEEKKEVKGKVGIVVGGSVEVDFLVEKVVKALTLEGVKGTVLTKVGDLAALPYAAQNMAKSVDVVIAAAFVPNDASGQVTQSLSSTLLQMGVSGRAPIVPGLMGQESLLEAKAMVSTSAEQWAKSCVTILNLAHGSVEITAAPEVVIPVKPVLTAEVNDTETLLEILRESLKSRGARGIVGLGRKFRIADDDNSGFIDFKEFQKVINEHALDWTPAQVKTIFDRFDDDKSGNISFDEFIITIRGQLNERRRNLVLMAFEILDADKSGIVELNDISAKYDASKHPDVIAGKRTKESVLAEFLDTFDTEEKDGKVTPSEFCKYYSNVSASIDEDDYFELMIRNAWHISGGEGWCANSSCRRVLCTHKDGRQTVEEIKNDLGIKADDKEAMIANLKAQGLNDIVDIELAGGSKAAVKDSASTTAAVPPSPARPSTANSAPVPTGRRGASGTGRSSLVLG